jgi:NADH-quinone oxidoreductase subunit H
MTTCLKYLVPISCFLFLGAAVWPLALASMTGGRTDWLPGHALGDRLPLRPATVAVQQPPAKGRAATPHKTNPPGRTATSGTERAPLAIANNHSKDARP